MKNLKKTTATLLTALFMISIFAVAMPVSADPDHLVVPASPVPSEDRIVIDLPSGFKLGDLKTISWLVKTIAGYPPHVDIILDYDIDGVANIDSLTAEIGENDNPGNIEWLPPTPCLQDNYVYNQWQKTFEYDAGVGDSVIDDETILWVTRQGSGCDNAPYGTLAELKAGTVTEPTGYTGPTITINLNVVVLRLEFEIDNWLGAAEAYIMGIKINSQPGVSLTGSFRHPMTSISVSPSSIDFSASDLVLGESYGPWVVTVDNTGETTVDLSAELKDDDGFYVASLYLDNVNPVDTWAKQLAKGHDRPVNLKLVIDRNAEAGTHTAVLVFWAEEA